MYTSDVRYILTPYLLAPRMTTAGAKATAWANIHANIPARAAQGLIPAQNLTLSSSSCIHIVIERGEVLSCWVQRLLCDAVRVLDGTLGQHTARCDTSAMQILNLR